jgi:hypothetical protein
LARAIRDAAKAQVLQERQVGAVWRDLDHTQISVADEDGEVEERAKVIAANYHVARRRAATKK